MSACGTLLKGELLKGTLGVLSKGISGTAGVLLWGVPGIAGLLSWGTAGVSAWGMLLCTSPENWAGTLT